MLAADDFYRVRVICHSQDLWFGWPLRQAFERRGIASSYHGDGWPSDGLQGDVLVISAAVLRDGRGWLDRSFSRVPCIVVALGPVELPVEVRDLPRLREDESRVGGRALFHDTYDALAADADQHFRRVLPVPVGRGTDHLPQELLTVRASAPVFICHATSDISAARWLHLQLCVDGFKPWLSEADLLPGSDWQHEIDTAIRTSAAVIVCLSKHMVDKFGFVQKEVTIALDTALEAPEGTAFIIPLRLDDCAVPRRLRRWQIAEGLEAETYSKIVTVLDRVMLARASLTSG